jgi:hypothetical protein
MIRLLVGRVTILKGSCNEDEILSSLSELLENTHTHTFTIVQFSFNVIPIEPQFSLCNACSLNV